MDLLANSEAWFDNREAKKDFPTSRLPDFKGKMDGIGLWLDSCPVDLVERVQALPQGAAMNSAVLQLAEDLLSNPTNWLDMQDVIDRVGTEKQLPTFRHAADGTGIWLESNMLPPNMRGRLVAVRHLVPKAPVT